MGKHPCAEPGCPILLDRGTTRCPEHDRARARDADRFRGTAKERGYDSRWAAFSRRWRERFPLCGMRADGQLHGEHSRCVSEGVMTPAECVDHILSMQNGGAQYDEANLQSLCMSCNNRKRVTHDGGFGRPPKG